MIELIREHAPADAQALRDDVVRQAAILRWIHIIGEAANRLSPELRDGHPDVPWRQIVDMRNLVAHAYDIVDLEIVWSVVQNDVPALERYVRSILPEFQ